MAFVAALRLAATCGVEVASLEKAEAAEPIDFAALRDGAATEFSATANCSRRSECGAR
jgi:hypothetical protein